MKRREFLLASGLLGAGGAQMLGPGELHAADSVRSTPQSSPAAGQKKRVLITSAHTRLAQILTAELDTHYELCLTGRFPVQTVRQFVRSDFEEEASFALAVRGADAIVHVLEPASDRDSGEAIERQTRGTYQLLQAAVQEQVRSVIYLSSLRMFYDCAKEFQIDEDWQPRPTPASGALPAYLGEFTCREFAREGRLRVIVLRLGHVVTADEAHLANDPQAWVDPRDVAQAVSLALQQMLADQPRFDRSWSVIHVCSHSPGSRFPLAKALRELGYQPSFGKRLR